LLFQLLVDDTTCLSGESAVMDFSTIRSVQAPPALSGQSPGESNRSAFTRRWCSTSCGLSRARSCFAGGGRYQR